MPADIADDFKELVRNRTDLVSLIAESVSLQSQRGGREFVGLCPFHDDHNPSMRVYPDRQSFRCWVCNEGGDCFSFVMKRERIGFREALEMLAQKANVELPRTYRAASAPGQENKNRLYEILSWAEHEFHQCLLQAPIAERARKYLRERGISGESIVQFKLGYHPDNWEWLLERARNRYTPEQLTQVRLTAQRDNGQGYYDYFVDRVLFPIRDTQGRAVAFGGRILPDSKQTSNVKYWNSPESVIFSKSRFLYGLDQARDTIAKTNTAVVVEGYTDCIMAHQHGLTNFIATLGTALNDTHVTGLKRFARQVVLVYDGDDAGRMAAERALPRFLPHEIDLRILTLPGDQDPADFLLAHGGEALRHLLAGAVEAWDQKFRLVLDRYGVDSIDARHRVLEDMLAILAQVPTNGGAGLEGKWQERENVILGALAHRLKVTEPFARARLADLRTGNQLRQGTERPERVAQVAVDVDETPQPSGPLFPRQPTRDDLAERELLEIIFTIPEQAEALRDEICPDELSHPHLRQLYGICLEMWDLGLVPSYDRVTARLEDARLKSLAAQIDEHARQVRIATEHVAHTLNYFRKRRAEHSLLAAISGPHGPGSASGSDMEAKARLKLATERHRQRMSKTTRN